MRCIIKETSFNRDNSGETIVEVTVAFTLLAIMLVVFSQGIAFATRAEVNASRSRDLADAAMIELQHKIAVSSGADNPQGVLIAVDDNNYDAYIRIYEIKVDGETIYYAVYGTDLQKP